MQYPPKPIASPAGSTAARSIISLFIFAGVYYLFVDKDVNQLITLLGVLIIHEGGHYLAMKIYNYQDVQMFFLPLLGAYVSGDKDRVSQKQRVAVILAGPFPGIIIGVLLNVLVWKFGFLEFQPAANLFVFLNVFNLIPVVPLDGGRLLEVLYAESKEIIQTIFILLSIAAIVFFAFYTASYILLLPALFMVLRINNMWNIRKIRKRLEAENISYDKAYGDLTDEEYWTISNTISDTVPAMAKSTGGDARMMEFVKSVLTQSSSYDLSAFGKLLVLALWLLFLLGAPMFSVWLMMTKQ